MTFDFQPILESDLVRLRPLRADDYEKLYSVGVGSDTGGRESYVYRIRAAEFGSLAAGL